MKKLEGKVALVSGGGRGIGRAIALKLAGDGARVVVNDLDPEPADEVVGAIRAMGGEAVACVGSVIEDNFAERFIGTAMETWGDLHIIVNNAGYTWDNVIQKMTDEQWDAILDVHLKAPFRILRAAAEPLRILAKKEKEEGRQVIRKVVNISSIAGTTGSAGQANYAAAKAGITGLTKTLAKEWGRYNVNVNCVAFGYIKTRLTQALGGEQATVEVDGRTVNVGVQPAALQMLDRTIPLGRGGTPEEAAGSVWLFCIPESDYVTGQVVVCGGGFGSVT
jgi:3-oxoacyl-[acyl-carrier protein] reductase